jgi:pimeloyl-ACP methyl ester carboxylesterase
MRRLALLLVALLAGGWFWLQSRNPEKGALDDAARNGTTGQYVRLTDGVTHYEVAGPDTGARVVLVHGFSVPAYIWDSTFIALTNAGFRVARYDSYGRGFSDRPDSEYSLSLFDRQLTGLLDSLGWRDPVHVMGLSFGGPITGTFVSRHPERVRSHVLIDPAAGGTTILPWYMTAPVIGPVLWQALYVSKAADGQAGDFVEPAKWPDWVSRYRVQQQYDGFGRALLRTRIAMSTVRYDSLYAATGRAGKSTLLLWGTEDKTVPIANAAQVRAGIPQAEFHPFEHAGHLPHMERTDVVNPLLITWLKAH